MALCTQEDIEQYSGFTFTDFTENGLVMTYDQWTSFISTLIPRVTQMMQRYCNVHSFEPAEVSEYHNGKGSTDYDTQISDYNDEDRIFFLRNLYANDGSLVVKEDTASKTSVPTWVTRSERPNAPLEEIDTIVVSHVATSNGNLTITVGGDTPYLVAVTTSMSISDICAAIVAAGSHIDGSGMTWTPGGMSPYVTLTSDTTGAASKATIAVGATGVTATSTVTQKGTAASGGDYEVMSENDVTRIMFHDNVPAQGYRNVKLTYNTGYPLPSVQLGDIKFQCIRACNNVLLQKKKIQEASSIRNFGVRDYSQMFDAFSEGVVIDEKIKGSLEQYRRAVIPGQFAYD